ncbi:TPA: GNAT family N-acetyltransferase [Streptococcus suis]|nr:GNAT family N-acetyltransferase [Streptococcus suis]HEM6083222.1 GNAT family N-acetyltransferase [Streptococcus suis]HEM6137080.1 GNAT family N-acetyltransferase [Streptococcus suis]HEM6138561.1 GNAT family N-acetyltransferase [Streptococcus suis]HEM6204739.1 GNAT family N-acetyltransferase [Streptococcus suis]
MELKELTLADIEMVKQLFLSVFSQEPWNDDWSDEEQLDRYIGDLLEHPRALCFGLIDQDSLIAISLGNIRYWYEGTEYRIEELCIARDYQGRGIGQDFLKRIEEQLVERKIIHILLQTERNLPAFSFYEKCGFRALEEDVTMVKKVGRNGAS